MSKVSNKIQSVINYEIFVKNNDVLAFVPIKYYSDMRM